MAKADSAPIEIFRAGTHRAAGGEALTFGEADLAAAASAYDPAKHEAPLVVGHPAHDQPAYGWVAGLSAEGGALFAEPAQVDAGFAEMVRAGRFKKISASFYKPDAEANPVQGAWYLRHVGFLGAQPPSVKGLRAVQFQDGEDDQIETVEFAGATPSPAAKPAEGDGPKHREETDMGDEIAKAKAAREALDKEALDKDRAAFAEAEKAHAERVAKFRADGAAATVDGLIDQGKVPPGHKAGLVAFMAALDEGDTLEFAEAEGGEARTVSPRAWFDSFLEALPKQIDFSERGGGDGGGVDSADPDALANAAIAFQEEQRQKGIDISIDRAVRHVAKQGS